MAKRKKRNAVTLLSLLLTLSVLIGVYVWYSGRPAETDDSSDDTESISLATFDTAEATAIHFTSTDVDIMVTLTDGVWKSDADPDRPIDQDNINSILDEMSDIEAIQMVVENSDNLSEYGLEDPTDFVQVTLEDGTIISLSIGDGLANADGYYAMVNDSTTVYVVNVSYEFNYTDFDFTEVEDAPSITAENITYLNIDSRDGDDVELKYDEYAKLDISGSNMYTWRILKPYGEEYCADSTAISDIQSNYTDFSFLDCVDYSGDSMSDYGLDNPSATIEIGYYEETTTPTSEASDDDTSTEDTTIKTEKEYKIYIGNQNDDGDYYVKSDVSDMVYTLDGSTVETMINVDVFSLVNPYINIPNIDTVDKITTDIAGTEYIMEITRTETTDEDGEDTTEAAYSYNKTEVDEETFKEVYQAMITPVYEAELKSEVDVSALDPAMTMSFHIFGDNDTTVTTTFYSYDKSFYIVDKGTGIYFLTDKRTIDSLALAISEFKTEE
jgi:hypothetical protein